MRITKTRGAHAQPRSGDPSRVTFVLVGAVVFAAAPLVAPATALATGTPALAGTGVITLVHAVPGLTADVSLDGKQVLTGFTASRVTDPVTLSAGKHTVALKADNGPNVGKTVLTATLDITAGTTTTAVMGLTPEGSPKAFVFPEAPIAVPSGRAGVVVRQVAATGPVNLVVAGTAWPVGTLTNGASVTTNAAPGTDWVTVTSPAGATVLGSRPATLQADRVTTLYLTGSARDKSLVWVATTRLASSLTSLSAIPTGDGSTLRPDMIVRSNVSVPAAGAIAIFMGGAAGLITRRRARARAVA